MDNSIKTFFSFLVNKDEKILTKLFFSVMVLILILLLNNIFGFSFYYNSDKKINQIKEVNLVLNDNDISNEVREGLLALRHDILYRKDIFEKIGELKLRKNTSQAQENYIKSSTHKVLNFLSSSWYFILVVVIFLVKSFRTRDFSLVNVLISLFFGLMIFGVCLALYFIMDLIPIIYSKMIWLNYVLNALVLLIIFYPLIKLDYENNFK